MFEKMQKMLKIFKFQANRILKDGTEIIIDGNLDVGVNVYVVTVDGDQPLPDGEYELGEPYDGFSIVVEGGVISDVMEPEVEPEPEPELETEVEPELETEEEESTDEPVNEVSLEDQLSLITEQLTEILSRLETLEQSNEDLSKDNEDLKKEKEEFSIQIEDFKTKLEKSVGAEPIKKKTENIDTQVFSQSSRLQVLKNYKDKKIT